MKPFFYDTETTGLPAFSEPSESPNQPHLVEIAAILCGDDGKVIRKVQHIIKPDGWSWDESNEAFKVHGITFEQAMDEGVPEPDALYDFICLANDGDMRVAHNETFDARIMRIAMKRYGSGVDSGTSNWRELSQHGKDEIADNFAAKPKFCTMKAATRACALPATPNMIAKGMGKLFKNPSLAEAYRHYFGQEITNAHRALTDAMHCMELFYAIQGTDPAVILASRPHW